LILLTYIGFQILPRRKFIPHEEWARQRKPHAPEAPPGLWWYRSLAPEEVASVLRSYLRARGARGAKKAPPDFGKKLEHWLSELIAAQGTGKSVSYWTLKSYALAHKIKPHPFMAWFRTLEEVAKELYPDRVPPGRRDKPLSDDEIQAIRAEYLETGEVHEIAARHEIPAWRIGQICRKEKEQRHAEWEKARKTDQPGETVSPPSDFADSDSEPF